MNEWASEYSEPQIPQQYGNVWVNPYISTVYGPAIDLIRIYVYIPTYLYVAQRNTGGIHAYLGVRSHGPRSLPGSVAVGFCEETSKANSRARTSQDAHDVLQATIL